MPLSDFDLPPPDAAIDDAPAAGLPAPGSVPQGAGGWRAVLFPWLWPWLALALVWVGLGSSLWLHNQERFALERLRRHMAQTQLTLVEMQTLLHEVRSRPQAQAWLPEQLATWRSLRPRLQHEAAALRQDRALRGPLRGPLSDPLNEPLSPPPNEARVGTAATGFALLDRDLHQASEAEVKRVVMGLNDLLATLRAHERLAEQRLAELVPVGIQLRMAGFIVGVATWLAALAAVLHERRERLRARNALKRHVETLGLRVQARTAELEQARQRLTQMAMERERLLQQEQRRISREVHDQLGQVFSAARLLLSALPSGSLPATTARSLEEVLDQGTQAARRIAADLRPPMLDELGLGEALRQLAAPLEPKLRVEVSLDEEPPAEAALTLYRVAQEGLANVLHHAQASQVWVRGWRDGAVYALQLDDNGVGPGTVRPGASGVQGLRERLALLGGNLSLRPRPGGGARLTGWVPLNLPARALARE